VDLPAPGVTLTAMPPTPFAPEINHAEVVLAGVAVRAEDVLPGDGYEDYVKPFRTVEDCHVHGALLGYVLRIGRRHGFARDGLTDLLGLIVALRALGESDPRAPGTHLALAGALRGARAWLAGNAGEWARVDDATRTRWERDQGLLAIAEGARTLRTERAWATVG
jgi:hypothetical protein